MDYWIIKVLLVFRDCQDTKSLQLVFCQSTRVSLLVNSSMNSSLFLASADKHEQSLNKLFVGFKVQLTSLFKQLYNSQRVSVFSPQCLLSCQQSVWDDVQLGRVYVDGMWSGPGCDFKFDCDRRWVSKSWENDRRRCESSAEAAHGPSGGTGARAWEQRSVLQSQDQYCNVLIFYCPAAPEGRGSLSW